MLDNPRSPRVRSVANLAKRPQRVETGTFLLEGPQAVSEALAYRPELLLEVFATPTALERYGDAVISVSIGLLNAVISAAQEIRAKRTLDALAIVGQTRPMVRRDGVAAEIAPSTPRVAAALAARGLRK